MKSVVPTPLTFFEVEKELILAYTTELQEAVFGEAPDRSHKRSIGLRLPPDRDMARGSVKPLGTSNPMAHHSEADSLRAVGTQRKPTLRLRHTITEWFSLCLYGADERKGSDRRMILARTPEGKLGDFSTWRFRTDSAWSPKVEETEHLCGRIATEYSVSWLRTLRRYVLICTANGLSEKIIARTSPEPWGPWIPEKFVYRCPESKLGKQVFCYSAKAHPMLASAPDEWILTYAANSFDFTQVMNDVRLYRPRFVRAKCQ